MKEGTIRFEIYGIGQYIVLSDIHSDNGEFQCVGRVRRQTDYSAQAKAKLSRSYLWFASGGNGSPERGPYASQKDAAKSLV